MHTFVVAAAGATLIGLPTRPWMAVALSVTRLPGGPLPPHLYPLLNGGIS
jgi:hypothetical protein